MPPLDHKKASATIYFDGIMLTCMNEDEARFEIGIVKHPEHFFSLDILEVGPENVSVVNHLLQYDKTIFIELKGDAPQAVSKHRDEDHDDEDFDRNSKEIDEEDFRWITDLESGEFHGPDILEFIEIDSAEEQGLPLQPKIYLKTGVLYTLQKSGKVFNKENFGKGKDPETLGHIADTMAADVYFGAPNSELVIYNEGKDAPSVTLKKKDNTKYFISLKNIRHRQSTDAALSSRQASTADGEHAADHPPSHHEGSDFRHYYLVIKDRNGNKFDLATADGSEKVPQNCDTTHLGTIKKLK